MRDVMERIRVVVVDDHPIVRQGVRSLLSNYPDVVLVGEADGSTQALELAGQACPDVFLLDIRMPDMNGVDLARRLSHECPQTRIIMLTSFDDQEYVMGALQAGAQGFVLKSASDEMLVNAVRAVYHGERVLSPVVMDRVVEQFAEYSREHAVHEAGLNADEHRILRLLAAGESNPRIAAELFLGETTVKRKVQDIFKKLGVTTRAQAAAAAAKRGLI